MFTGAGWKLFQQNRHPLSLSPRIVGLPSLSHCIVSGHPLPLPSHRSPLISRPCGQLEIFPTESFPPISLSSHCWPSPSLLSSLSSLLVAFDLSSPLPAESVRRNRTTLPQISRRRCLRRAFIEIGRPGLKSLVVAACGEHLSKSDDPALHGFSPNEFEAKHIQSWSAYQIARQEGFQLLREEVVEDFKHA